MTAAARPGIASAPHPDDRIEVPPAGPPRAVGAAPPDTLITDIDPFDKECIVHG